MSKLITLYLNEDIKSLNDSCSYDSKNDDNTILYNIFFQYINKEHSKLVYFMIY